MNPHSPPHYLFQQGIYMVTAGTYQKLPYLDTPERRDFFLQALFERAMEFAWNLQAWAVLDNHYHFIAQSPEHPDSLRRFISKLHMTTAKQLNLWDGTSGRKVWYQYWDRQITFEPAYFARLNYVNNNPQHHGVTEDARNYRCCSAAWFAENASLQLIENVTRFQSDKLALKDDF